MGTIKDIMFAPGIVKDDTVLMAGKKKGLKRWADSDMIRFVAGLPQKIGGWATFSENTFTGICRALLSWMDANNNIRTLIGTHSKLMVMEALTITNITPLRATASLTDPFTTTSGSATVTVADAAHGAGAGDYVQISGASAVGGITIDGNYQIATIVDADSYTITHTSVASSSATGGGSVTAKHEIAVGRQDGAQGTGWGVGAYGAGTYGTARSVYVLLPPRVWSLQQWGQYVLAMPTDGNLYQWSNDITARAVLVSNAPTGNRGMFVTDEQIVVLLDAGGTKMKAQWCDREDNTNWTSSDTTTAGSRQLQGGTTLLQGLKTARTNLILSDAAVWTMTFIGDQDVFSFDQVAAGAAGGISPHCAEDVDGVVYWMGRNDFYMYDGTVRRIPNSKDIRRFVFDNIAKLQAFKVHSVYSSIFNEIWWFYSTSTEIDRYVKYNLEDRCWDVGSLVRTAGIDVDLYDYPLFASTDGYLYGHEQGSNAAGSAMNEYIESAPFQLSDGNRMVDILSLYPDFKDLSGTITVSMLTKQYPQGSESEESSSSVTSSTETVDMRASGRQAQLKISSSTTGTHWRLGVPKFELEQGGQR